VPKRQFFDREPDLTLGRSSKPSATGESPLAEADLTLVDELEIVLSYYLEVELDHGARPVVTPGRRG
jgi:hypothetical protein